MPVAKSGIRVVIVSIEPIILLSVTRKIDDVAEIEVSQPFYAPAWQAGDVCIARDEPEGMSASFRVRVAAGESFAEHNPSLWFGHR
jgi:hypothetical protein